MLGWLAIQPAGLDLRERRVVTLAGLAPDLDGLGVVVDLATARTASPTSWFADYHHVLSHNLLAGVAIAAVAWVVGGRRWRVCGLALLVFHLHLACDAVGSGGPDGSPWTLAYAWPFSAQAWSWSGQWALNAWPNILISLVAAGLIAWSGVSRGRTVLEVLSIRADAILVGVLRRWAGIRGRAPGA